MIRLYSPKLLITILSISFFGLGLNAQQLKITDFVLFGGQSPTSTNPVTTPVSPGFCVQISSSTNIASGRIGSYNLIKTTGSSTLGGSVNSGGTISLTNSNTVSGSITAQNQGNTTGNILQMGSNAYVGGNIDVNGSITINGGKVVGNVTHPLGTTYSGPKPGGVEFKQTPTIPTLPQFPLISKTTSAGTTDVVSTSTISPGTYRDMKLTGNQTVTFSGPGDYYLRSIHNTNANTFVFDFKNTTTGNIRVFIDGDADLGKQTSSLKNGGAATRIYFEVHGNGSTSSKATYSFNIANGASNSISWLGTVWAPYAAINIGSGTGSSYIDGALWSTTQVNIQSGASMVFDPFGGLIQKDTTIVPGYQPPGTGKSNDIIGPELIALCQTFNTGIIPSTDIYQITNDSVLIEVVTKTGFYSNALNILTSQYGMANFINNGPNSPVITGKIPISQLCALNSDSTLAGYINSCRPVYAPINNTGLITTGGDTAMHSYIVRNAFHLTGKGIKVGVLSDGYNTIPGNPAAIDIANGDLPGTGNLQDSTPVDVLLDYPGRTTDEGRAILQTVHDIAPDATLAFRTGSMSEGDFAQGIYQLAQDSCKVIADDITYITAPFFKDGLAAQAVNAVKALGVSYFSAAGNFGASSYQSVFNPAPAPAGITGQAHNFGGGDILQSDSLQAGNYVIVMQWEDSIYSLGQGGALNDFDIYLTDDNGNILFGMNRPNLGADPIEVLPFTAKANTRTNIMIVRAAGNTPNVRIKFIVFRGGLKFNEYSTGNSTIVGQANAQGAMAVAAARYVNTPAYGVNPPLIESFSSLGGTPVYGVVRNKPDFTAPDGGNTSVNFNSLDIEKDGIPNFFGTSAATPHAAGVAALILQGKKLFYNKVLEPDSVRIILGNTALDMNTPGFDNVSGAGFIQADAAVGSFAAPTPELDSLIVPNDSTIVPGKSTFTVTLKGKYFLPSTVVKVRGVAVPTQIINSTQATAQIGPFGGNAPIQAYTNPVTPSGLDGSYSDSLFFYNQVKKNITITADNKTKKFGEQLPTFTSTILVNNVPLDSTGLTLRDLNLDSIVYTTSATSNSNVGLYAIQPSFRPLSSTDSLAFELYNYTFNNGVLFNNKMPLLITVRDTTLTYGDKIAGFNFIYTYNDSLIPAGQKANFLSYISLAHQANINNTVCAFVDGKTIINGRTLTQSDLVNMSVMASGKSIINARNIINGRTIINGVQVYDTTKVIDLALQSIFNYQIDSSSSPLVNAKNIINARTIINARSIINGVAQVNGKTIINGTTVLNSNSVGDTSDQNVVVIIDQDDVSGQTNVISDIKSVNMVTGITAGNFWIVPAAMVSENFDITYKVGNLTILPAALAVKAKDTSMFQGDTLPRFVSVVTGLKNGDSVLGGPSYTLSPAYLGNAGTYSIIPSNIVLGCSSCYITTYAAGTLYVDPKGGQSKNLKPYLVCVDTLVNDPTGLKYIATFGCTNSNNTVEYVPIGPNNTLTGAGAATAVGTLTQIFQPGGTNTCQIKFNGTKITWVVKSYNTSQYTATGSDASSSSSRCKKGTTSSAIASSLGSSGGNALALPNPTTGRFVITTDNGTISDKDLYIVDAAGKKYVPNSVARVSSNSLQIELPRNATQGVYFVRARIDNTYKIFKVIKL